MSDQTQPQPQSTPPTTAANAPALPITNPGSPQQQGAAPALPISPFTGEPYDPKWGAIIQKGGREGTIQQVMRPEIERKTNQAGGESNK